VKKEYPDNPTAAEKGGVYDCRQRVHMVKREWYVTPAKEGI